MRNFWGGLIAATLWTIVLAACFYLDKSPEFARMSMQGQLVIGLMLGSLALMAPAAGKMVSELTS